MPRISEMTLEELQDYALDLENERNGLNERVTSLNGQIEDLTSLNMQLQRRNNDLLMRVEQPHNPIEDPPPAEEKPVVSCEDFARNLFHKGV